MDELIKQLLSILPQRPSPVGEGKAPGKSPGNIPTYEEWKQQQGNIMFPAVMVPDPRGGGGQVDFAFAEYLKAIGQVTGRTSGSPPITRPGEPIPFVGRKKRYGIDREQRGELPPIGVSPEPQLGEITDSIKPAPPAGTPSRRLYDLYTGGQGQFPVSPAPPRQFPTQPKYGSDIFGQYLPPRSPLPGRTNILPSYKGYRAPSPSYGGTTGGYTGGGAIRRGGALSGYGREQIRY